MSKQYVKWKLPKSVLDFYNRFENKELQKNKNSDKEFEIYDYYEILTIVGRGAYGIVAGARDKRTNKIVAIKKIQKAFEHKIFAKRTLRELKILRLLQHENILQVNDIILPESREKFNDIYLITELVEGDLYSIIKNQNQLEKDHIMYIIYQILRGLKYQHSARVLHRDLKPRNILISQKCEVKICDYGLARVLVHDNQKKNDNMTDYVATRWYRAPELLLGNEKYDEKIDLWSVGCILAEMFLQKPFLMGTDWKNQLFLILDLLGIQQTSDLDFVENQKARDFLMNYDYQKNSSLKSAFENVDISDEAMDLLQKLLTFNPEKRISVQEALKHPYFADLYCPEDEPTREPLKSIEFSFEYMDLNKEQIKDCIYEEILFYHFQDVKNCYQNKINKNINPYEHILKNENQGYSKYEKQDDEKLEEL